jgi:hypothetical protein
MATATEVGRDNHSHRLVMVGFVLRESSVPLTLTHMNGHAIYSHI